ncbi:MAG TPA: hypothetical protein VGF54_10085 [Streptosporangiaceae bacterium]
MGRGARMMVLLVPMVMTLVWAGAGAASAATLTVCPSGCQYSQIGPAVAAAGNGDTIQVGPGTYQGGITIDVSVKLAGAGAGSTIIRGGDHVLTIGALGASGEPTVSVSGVTITGGLARSSQESVPYWGKEGVVAAGGGVEIPPQDIPNPADGPPVNGATVTISDSVITGNRADPAQAVPDGVPCPGKPCPIAWAFGGGIDSWGSLTLVHTTVSNNTAGAAAGLPGIASDADGGGIFSAQGSLNMTNTTLSGNQAIAAAPDGQFAEGGAVFVRLDFTGSDALTVSNSTVTGNSASLTTNLPKFVGGQLIDMNANSGGIHVGNDVPTTVDRTAITHNSVTTKGLRGEPLDFDPAMLVGDSQLTMSNSVISGNTLSATMATTADTGPAGSTLEIDGGGTITNTRITDNTSTVVSPDGVAGNAGAGLAASGTGLVTVRGGVISHNIATAKTSTGSATVEAVGVLSDSFLELDGVQVSGNTGTATGPTGTAQGGGIWNGVEFAGPQVQLTLDHTTVTHNSLSGSPGITVQGGGLFTTLPVTLRDSVIAGNTPDQCFGCTGNTANAAGPRTSGVPARAQEGSGPSWPGR